MAATIRSMEGAAPSSVVPSANTTANSSPPKRATRSSSRTVPIRRSATTCSTESPVSWPWVSFTGLKSSRSTSATVTAPVTPSRRWRRAERLPAPVSGSVTASRRSVWWRRCSPSTRLASRMACWRLCSVPTPCSMRPVTHTMTQPMSAPELASGRGIAHADTQPRARAAATRSSGKPAKSASVRARPSARVGRHQRSSVTSSAAGEPSSTPTTGWPSIMPTTAAAPR